MILKDTLKQNESPGTRRGILTYAEYKLVCGQTSSREKSGILRSFAVRHDLENSDQQFACDQRYEENQYGFDVDGIIDVIDFEKHQYIPDNQMENWMQDIDIQRMTISNDGQRLYPARLRMAVVNFQKQKKRDDGLKCRADIVICGLGGSHERQDIFFQTDSATQDDQKRKQAAL